MAVLMRKARTTTGVPTYLKEHRVQHVDTGSTQSAALPLLTIASRLNTDFTIDDPFILYSNQSSGAAYLQTVYCVTVNLVFRDS